ncbi:MAG: hypothetical protein IJ392_02470 [Clostridia bacterium]|nr:hypothetical protein [Clostridia bacterium]
MRLTPIPRAARPHTVGIAPCTQLDVNHAPSWGGEISFPFVKVEFATRTRLEKMDTRQEVTGVCYIDQSDAPTDPGQLLQESNAAGHPARLRWQGKGYLIETVTPHFHPDGTVHHWKVIFR